MCVTLKRRLVNVWVRGRNLSEVVSRVSIFNIEPKYDVTKPFACWRVDTSQASAASTLINRASESFMHVPINTFEEHLSETPKQKTRCIAREKTCLRLLETILVHADKAREERIQKCDPGADHLWDIDRYNGGR